MVLFPNTANSSFPGKLHQRAGVDVILQSHAGSWRRPTIGRAGFEELHVNAVHGEQGLWRTLGGLGDRCEISSPFVSCAGGGWEELIWGSDFFYPTQFTIVNASVDRPGDAGIPHGVVGLLVEEGGKDVLLQRAIPIHGVVLAQQAVGDAVSGDVVPLTFDGRLAALHHVVGEEHWGLAALVGVLEGKRNIKGPTVKLAASPTLWGGLLQSTLAWAATQAMSTALTMSP